MSKLFKNILFKTMGRFEKTYKTLVVAFMFALTCANSAYASQPPKIVTGTVNLLTAASGWLTLIIPIGAGLFVGFHALQKSMTDDQAVIAEKNKLIKNTVIGAIIATSAMGLITVILGFYE